jgi:SAM-dependent methyltransferase
MKQGADAMIKSIIGGRHRPAANPQPEQVPPPLPEGPTAWETWLASPPGLYVLGWEHARFDEAVADLFGFHAVQLGLPSRDFLRANRMPHRIGVATSGPAAAEGSPAAAEVPATPSDASPADRVPTPGDPDPGVQGPIPLRVPRSSVLVEHFEELPFDTQSIDLVVLPHVLEFAADPHQVLREVDRVLRPEGRVIISGFNPVSLWGARQLALRAAARPFLPRDGQFIAVPRLRDWFKLLSFEMYGGRYGCYRPPCRTQLWLDRTSFLEKAGDRWWPICGAVYIVSAVKRVRAMRLIGPAWKRKRGRAAVAVVAQRRAVQPGDRPQLRIVSSFDRRSPARGPEPGDGRGNDPRRR